MTDATTMRKLALSRLDIRRPISPVFVELNDGQLSMTVSKADRRVYRVVLQQATQPIENARLASMFMPDERVELGNLSADVEHSRPTRRGSQICSIR